MCYISKQLNSHILPHATVRHTCSMVPLLQVSSAFLLTCIATVCAGAKTEDLVVRLNVYIVINFPDDPSCPSFGLFIGRLVGLSVIISYKGGVTIP